MIIPREKWAEASGTLVERSDGTIYRILGFIDKPAMLLQRIYEPPYDPSALARETIVMGSPQSEEFVRLVKEYPGASGTSREDPSASSSGDASRIEDRAPHSERGAAS